jgi:hypothetical protein
LNAVGEIWQIKRMPFESFAIEAQALALPLELIQAYWH